MTPNRHGGFFLCYTPHMSWLALGRPISISMRVLLALYAVIPLVLLLVMVDMVVWGGAMMRALPRLPESLIWWSLLFPFPHIIASYFSFFDRAYLTSYRNRIIQVAIPLGVGTAILGVYAPEIMFLLFVLYSMVHITFQQTGLTQLMLQQSGKLFVWWKWVLVLGATTLYLSLYPSVLSSFLSTFALPLLLSSSLVAILMAYVLTRGTTSLVGRWYAWLTTALIPLSVLMLYLGYPVFAILIPRAVHDLTAFVFYLTHDLNRNSTDIHNFLYMPFIEPRTILLLPVLMLCFSVGIVYALFQAPLIGGSILVVCSVVHYYIESFMWKKGSPHRAQIAFSK